MVLILVIITLDGNEEMKDFLSCLNKKKTEKLS